MPLQNAPWFSARVASSYFFRISRPSRGHFEEWDQNSFFKKKKTTRINPRFGLPKTSKIPVPRDGYRRRLLCPSKNIPLCVPRVFVTARPGRGHFERALGRAPHARTGTHRGGDAASGLGRGQRGLRGPGRLRQHLGPHPEKRPGVNSTFREKRISYLSGF